MSSTQAAVALGASGSVGNALITALIRNGSFKPIVSLVRRSQPDQVAMARDAGIDLKHLAFMSAAGADPAAAATGSGAAGMARYARVKGEAEEAVKANGPAIVSRSRRR